jgi:hypothetical protein
MNALVSLRYTALWACLLACLLASCNKKPGVETHIPAEASAVASVNTSRLFAKVALDQLGELSADKLFGGFGANRPPLDPNSDEAKWRELIANPSSAGIDVFADVYAFAGPWNGQGPEYAALLLSLSSPASLEDFLRQTPPTPLLGTTQEGENCQYRYLLNELGERNPKALMAWNSTVVVFLSAPEAPLKPLHEAAERICGLPADHALMKQSDAFAAFLDKGSDMGAFLQLQQLELQSVMPALPQQPAKQAALHLSFNNGEAVLEGVLYLDPEQAQSYQKALAQAPPSEALDAIDLARAIGFSHFRYDPEQAQQLARNPLFRLQASAFLQQAGVSDEEAAKLLGQGYLLVACTGMASETREVVTMTLDEEFNTVEKVERQQVMVPQFTAAFQTDLETAKSVLPRLSSDGNGGYRLSVAERQWHLRLDGGLLIASTQPGTQDFGGQHGDWDWAYDSPAAGFIDIPQALQAAGAHDASPQAALVAASLGRLSAHLSPPAKDRIEARMTLQMADDDRNALVMLLELLRQLDDLQAGRQPDSLPPI